MNEPKRPVLDPNRLDHIEQAQVLIDVQPDAVGHIAIALAQAHATISIAQTLLAIAGALKPDPKPPRHGLHETIAQIQRMHPKPT